MLMLSFQLGDGRYAIPARDVMEIASMVKLEPLPKTPDYIAGLFNFHGQHVPVLDLCKLVNNQFCSNRITTRMILVEFPLADGGVRTLGLLAERVTETLKLNQEDFSETGISSPDAPFIGKAVHTDNGLIRQLSIIDLVPPEVQSQLYPAEAG